MNPKNWRILSYICIFIGLLSIMACLLTLSLAPIASAIFAFALGIYAYGFSKELPPPPPPAPP